MEHATAMSCEVGNESLLQDKTPFEDQHIDGILYYVEMNIRNFCYAMSLEQHELTERNNIEALSTMFSAFYSYVDDQMLQLTRLRRNLEKGLTAVSINKLRASDEFKIKPAPRYAFTSEEAYQNHLKGFTESVPA